MVYFISDGRYVKIGHTKTPGGQIEESCVHYRLNSLQSGNARPLRVVLLLPGTVQEELGFHRRFNKEWIRGEWFRLSPRLKQFIKSDHSLRLSGEPLYSSLVVHR
jgi:hypothetical protein